MTFVMCEKAISGRSKYEELVSRKCYRPAGHAGRCDEYPYLTHLKQVAPRVEAKIKRDATKTTGAAWKSDDAGPNRIDRWVMLVPDEDLKSRYGINIAEMKPQVQAKLREKAATYEECMEVAAKLTLSVYEMLNAPVPTQDISEYLVARFGGISRNTTRCIVCLDHLDFGDFEQAQRGRARLETAHANPRMHSPDNVGFAHRECNIAQGSLSLGEFYGWVRGIILRVDSE